MITLGTISTGLKTNPRAFRICQIRQVWPISTSASAHQKNATKKAGFAATGNPRHLAYEGERKSVLKISQSAAISAK
jgi:hypothetical protein